MSIYWRIFCVTDNQWEFEWSDTALTECPVNNLHSVILSSNQDIGQEKIVSTYSTPVSIITPGFFKRICSISYNTSDFGSLRRIKMIAKKSEQATSFDINIVDFTNNIILLTVSNLTNEDDNINIDLGVITSPPNGQVILEISGRLNGTGELVVNEITLISGFID